MAGQLDRCYTGAMKIVIPVIGAITIPGGLVVMWRVYRKNQSARMGFRAARTYQKRRRHEQERNEAGR